MRFREKMTGFKKKKKKDERKQNKKRTNRGQFSLFAENRKLDMPLDVAALTTTPAPVKKIISIIFYIITLSLLSSNKIMSYTEIKSKIMVFIQ